MAISHAILLTAPLACLAAAPLLVATPAQDSPATRSQDPVPAEEPAAELPGEARIDPRAERILWQMGEYLKSAPAFEFRAETLSDEAHPSGQWVQLARTGQVAVHRGRGMRASVVGDLQNREFWCDLEMAAMLDPDEGLYALVAVPGDVDGALDHLLDEYGISWPLADLVYSDPFVVLIEGVESGVYVGQHRVEDVSCHHLAFRQPTIDWEIWVDAGAHPVPRKVRITYRAREGAPRFTATISDWNFAPHLPDIVFDFDAPEGAEQIEMEAVGGR